MGLCALLQCQNKPACLAEASIQSQLMGDFIHLFTGLQKAIQVRDEDEDDSDDDEEGNFIRVFSYIIPVSKFFHILPIFV